MPLSANEKRSRRLERLRLQAFLASGGALVREDLPAGVVAWCRASRSGFPFSDRAVNRLKSAGGFTFRKVEYVMGERVTGHLIAVCAGPEE